MVETFLSLSLVLSMDLRALCIIGRCSTTKFVLGDSQQFDPWWGYSVTSYPSLEPSIQRTSSMFTSGCTSVPQLPRATLEPTKHLYFPRSAKIPSESMFITFLYLGFELASSVWLRHSRLWSCKAYEFLTPLFQEPKAGGAGGGNCY